MIHMQARGDELSSPQLHLILVQEIEFLSITFQT